MDTVTIEQIGALAEALTGPVNNYLTLQAIAELETAKCEAIQREVLRERLYFANATRPKERLTDPKRAWLMPKFDHDRYWAIVHDRYLRAGYKIATYGYCPALMAQEAERIAGRAVVDAAVPFNPSLTCDALLSMPNCLEVYRAYLDTLVGIVVSRPGYRHPLQKVTT